MFQPFSEMAGIRVDKYRVDTKEASKRNESSMDVRNIYQEKADAQLHEWQEWIEHFKTDPTIPGVKKGISKQQVVERLEDCHRVARFQLDELRGAQSETWELAKQAV